MISGGTTDGNSNRVRSRFDREECMVMEEPTSRTGSILGFVPRDLEGIMVLHNDALVIRAIVDNFDVT